MTIQIPVRDETVLETLRPGRRRWSAAWRSRRLIIGLSIVVFFLLAAIVGPLLAGDPETTSYDQLQGPSARHLLGTTNTGQDVLNQMLNGTRGSVFIGLLVGVLATTAAIVIGVVGGYLGGLADEGFSLLSNVFLVIPTLPLVILISDYTQSHGVFAMGLVISLITWAGASRVLRAQTMSLRSRDYIDAARVSSEPAWRIVLFEVLPNLVPIIAAQFVFSILTGILLDAALSFLGLGGIGAGSSWGAMLYFAQNGSAFALGAWWWFIPPGLCIAVLGAGLSLINFSIDELIDPRLKVTRGSEK